MKIITVTLNPVLERTLLVNYLAVGYHNSTSQTSCVDAAGRGVNISRALATLGIPTEAVVLLANDASGKTYQGLIREENFTVHPVTFKGQTRSNIVILDTGNKTETVINEDNEGVTIREVEQVAAKVEAMIGTGDIVVFGGPLPRLIPDAVYTDLVTTIHHAGGKVMLDIPGQALKEAIAGKPEMIFMTQNETEAYFNFPVRTEEDMAYCVRQFLEEGASKILMLLNDHRGAMLGTPEDILIVDFPEHEEQGTHSGIVGAMLAAFLASEIEGRNDNEAFGYSAAAVLYAIDQVGNSFPAPEDLTHHLGNSVLRTYVPQ